MEEGAEVRWGSGIGHELLPECVGGVSGASPAEPEDSPGSSHLPSIGFLVPASFSPRGMRVSGGQLGHPTLLDP